MAVEALRIVSAEVACGAAHALPIHAVFLQDEVFHVEAVAVVTEMADIQRRAYWQLAVVIVVGENMQGDSSRCSSHVLVHTWLALRTAGRELVVIGTLVVDRLLRVLAVDPGYHSRPRHPTTSLGDDLGLGDRCGVVEFEVALVEAGKQLAHRGPGCLRTVPTHPRGGS